MNQRLPLFCATLCALSLVIGCPARTGGKSKRPHARAVIAWTIGGAQSFGALKRSIDAVTVASPCYYRVTINGDKTSLVDWDGTNPVDRTQSHELATKAGAKLVPLVACLQGCARTISKLLAKPAARKQHVELLAKVVKRDNADGIFVDYEGLTCSKKVFNAFLDELAKRLAKDKKTVGVAITEPCGIDPKCNRPGYPFDIAHIGKVADYVAVMSYDYAVDGSDAVAPRAWVKAGLRRVKREAGGNLRKFFAGVAFYGRITRGLTRDTGVLWSEVKARRIQGKQFKVVSKRYDSAKLAHVAQVKVGSLSGKLYYHDHLTLASRLKLFESEGFKHIAIWRLGGEDPCNWSVIRAWQAGKLSSGIKCK